MSVSDFVRDSNVHRRLHEGPLGVHIDRYAARLSNEGHCYQSGARCLCVVGDFSRWLERNQLDLGDVNENTVERYLRFRALDRQPFFSDRPALGRLLTVLREIDAIASPPPRTPGPLERIEQDFQQYVLQERGLAGTTFIRHLPALRRFLQECGIEDNASFAKLTAADVTHFVERHVHDQSPRSAQSLCWTLRAFTRFLLYRGHITVDLATAVPSIRTWRFRTLPEHLSLEQVQRVLDSCDRQTSLGKRDYAILLLLARLGLRAKEIATLTLDDIDWQSGQLRIRGKGRRRACMPLLREVGRAMAEYLAHGRPHTDDRHVFVRTLAPHIGFASSSAISQIAVSALQRASLHILAEREH